jgi:hypothetical protein
MNVKAASLKTNKSYIKSSTLLLLAFATAFFPRIIQSYGAPAVINFLHFAIVPFACGLALFTTQTKNRRQISISKEILAGLLIFLTIGFASALFNQVGAINVFVDCLLFTEPFMLLLAIISLPMSEKSLGRFRAWIVGFNVFHLLLAFFQWLVLRLVSDDMQGVFYRTGSGHVVGSSVSLSFSLFYFTGAKNRPFWLRALVLVASLIHLVVSDAKQVIVTFILGFAILSLTKTKNPSKALLYIIGLAIFIIAFQWGIENVEALRPFKTWIRPELYGSDGEGTKMKLLGINTTLSHFDSPLNWWLGLGPGHTIGRLGGWMLRDYSFLLKPLGATTSTVADEVWAIARDHWLGPVKGSSFFAPFFGWAAIWGDFGFLGLFAYLYLCSIIWRKVCVDDFSKVLMLTVCVHGLIFTQMEEPGYMLTIASLIGLRWQEHQAKERIWVQLNPTPY